MEDVKKEMAKLNGEILGCMMVKHVKQCKACLERSRRYAELLKKSKVQVG